MIADRGSPYCSSEDPPHRRGWHRLGLTAGTSTGVWRVRTYERGCGGRSAGRGRTHPGAGRKEGPTGRLSKPNGERRPALISPWGLTSIPSPLELSCWSGARTPSRRPSAAASPGTFRRRRRPHRNRGSVFQRGSVGTGLPRRPALPSLRSCTGSDRAD